MSAQHVVAGERAPTAVVATLVALSLSLTALSSHAWTTRAPGKTAHRIVAPIARDEPIAPSVTPPNDGAVMRFEARAVVECAPRVSVRFDRSNPLPPDSAYTPLRTMAAWARTHAESTLVVEGHADGWGSDEANLRMSQARARAVAAVLLRAGVERGRVQTRAFGAWLPSDVDDEAHNRRVVVRVANVCGGDWVEVEP